MVCGPDARCKMYFVWTEKLSFNYEIKIVPQFLGTDICLKFNMAFSLPWPKTAFGIHLRIWMLKVYFWLLLTWVLFILCMYTVIQIALVSVHTFCCIFYFDFQNTTKSCVMLTGSHSPSSSRGLMNCSCLYSDSDVSRSFSSDSSKSKTCFYYHL